MFVVVCYDIVEDRRRNKVMKHMKSYGFHVQKSVFECFLDSKKIVSLEKRLRSLIDEEEDSVRIYVLPENLVDKTILVGKGKINKVPKLILL